MENEIVKITKNGQEIECETLFTFESDDTGKHYIAYTDHSVDDKGAENIYISSFDPSLGTDKLQDLDEKEMEMARDVLEQLKEYK
jgi:uncharacterized protein YrzB (UPF0473 family)